MKTCRELPWHLRSVCEGTYPGETLDECNAFRSIYGADPLDELPEREASKTAALPTILIRGLNFASALARHAWGGFETRTPEEIEERIAICQGCEFRSGDGDTINCTKCGCQCSASSEIFLNKLAWKTEKCPEGKWE